MKIVRILLVFFIATVAHASPPAEKAVCIVPIADLIGEDVPQKNSSSLYASLPIAHKNFEGPARVHQLLFNEIVEIKGIRGNEALIRLTHLFYETTQLKQPQTLYWTLLKNIRPLKQITAHGVPLSTFPQPLTRDKASFEKALHNTVSLTHPFFDPKTNFTYSAGTRFVIANNEHSNNHISVHIFDVKKNQPTTTTIPLSHCLVHGEKNNEERLADFVHLVTSWARQPSGFIPYVWGGCSVGKLCNQEQFVEEKNSFSRPELSPTTPIAGLDCTGLVARAAHLAGIPYFYKNSFTIAKYLKPLSQTEKISEGDLIWIPGHVMVVSSLKNSLLVEARHYSHGYGKVHEIALAKQFKGVQTYHELAATFFAKRPLKRVDIHGKIVQVIPEFKILKLASVWT